MEQIISGLMKYPDEKIENEFRTLTKNTGDYFNQSLLFL
jgi:hypothetical protein